MRNSAYTLIELLIVIIILGILAIISVSSFSGYFEKARDSKRINDINLIKRQIDTYIASGKTLLRPIVYGEGTSSPGWWDTWWDSSAEDKDGNGIFFLDFLQQDGFTIPVDPINDSGQLSHDANITRNGNGHRYLYFFKPKGYVCTAGCGGMADNSTPYCRNNAFYMLAVRLEGDASQSLIENNSLKNDETQCECIAQSNIWVNEPIYRLCGNAEPL